MKSEQKYDSVISTSDLHKQHQLGEIGYEACYPCLGIYDFVPSDGTLSLFG